MATTDTLNPTFDGDADTISGRRNWRNRGLLGKRRDHSGLTRGSTESTTTSSTTTSKVKDATRRAGETISSNPTGAMVGGLAVGALLGMVVPATRRETTMLAPVGQRLATVAREKAREAAHAGRQKVDEVTGQVMTNIGSAVVDAVGSTVSKDPAP